MPQTASTQFTPSKSRKWRKRPAFFYGYWYDGNGKELRRIYRTEYPEIWRLWTKHKDIRTGRVRA